MSVIVNIEAFFRYFYSLVRIILLLEYMISGRAKMSELSFILFCKVALYNL